MGKSNDGGKGSSPRPYSVDQDTFTSNWDRIFGKSVKDTPIESEDPITRNNQETQEAKIYDR